MMTKHVIFSTTILWGLALLLNACGPEEKFEAQLNDIQKYQSKLDSVEKVLNSIDFDSLDYIVTTAHESEKLVKKIYNEDTLNEEFARAITEFKSIRKNMKNPLSKKAVFQNEIDTLQKQLSNLETDIKNGVRSQEEVKKYTKKEIADTKHLLNSFENFYTTYEIVIKVFETHYPVVDKTIKILKEKYESSTS